MTVTIKIDCDNAAFARENCGPELAQILKELAVRISGFTGTGVEKYWDNVNIKDRSGNTVGKVTVTA